MADSIKAVRGLIDLGGVLLNVYLMPNGGYKLAGRNVTDAVDMRHGSLSEFFKVKTLKELPGTCFIRSVTGETFCALPTELAVQYWGNAAINGCVKAQKLLELLRNSPDVLGVQSSDVPVFLGKNKKSSKRAEASIRDKIAVSEGGVKEVVIISGKIDVLTSTQLIEVKHVKAWKEAIGQVLVYGHYYPSHTKRIHFFGTAHSEIRELIKSHCDKLNICITWEV